jgi:hypothetical protein
LLVAGPRPLTKDEQLCLRLLELGECVVLVFKKRYALTQYNKY